MDESDTREPERVSARVNRPAASVRPSRHGIWILRSAWVLGASVAGAGVVLGLGHDPDRTIDPVDASKRDPHSLRDGIAGDANAHMAREEARAAGIIGQLDDSMGAWNSPSSPFGSDAAAGSDAMSAGSDAMSAIGSLMGDQIGEDFGFGGLGLRGAGNIGSGTADVLAGGAVTPTGADVLSRLDAEPEPSSEHARFESALEQPLSTFSVDVDTAAYTYVRQSLTDRYAPQRERVRIEEMINYFDYDYPRPTGQEPFAVTTEVGDCPWNAEHRLVHIGIQGREISTANVPARNLVVLIDVSGSMESPEKLPLLTRALDLLAGDLRAIDRVAMVVYAGASGVALPATAGDRHGEIRAALTRLSAGGSTNGAAGIEQAYAIARENFRADGINRVILATDGDFNVGVTSEADLTALIEREREHGVFLTVLGFGDSYGGDATMELLADRGNGNYAAIDSLAEAERVLVREASATLVTIAKDVKLQVVFDPTYVATYRLIGYENRRLRDEEFDDDARDAGEIGAGHTVTALYEIVPTARATDSAIASVRIRYKPPLGARSVLSRHAVLDTGAPASESFRFAGAVAAFGMLLRGTSLPTGSLESVRALAAGAIGSDPHGDRAELLRLIDLAVAQRDAPERVATSY